MMIPPRIAKRRIKLLESELQMLQKYKTDASLLFDEYAIEYSRDLCELESKIKGIPEQNLVKDSQDETGDTLIIDLDDKDQQWKKTDTGWEKINSNNEQDSLEKKSKPEPPNWAKKLYRKIALVAHPDRVSEASKRQRLKKIFLEANDAISAGDFEKLLGFALELDIPAVKDDISLIPLLQKRIDDIKLEIKKMETSAEWLWGEGLGAPSMRANIANIHFLKKGIQVKIEDLIAIITQMEKDSEPQ